MNQQYNYEQPQYQPPQYQPPQYQPPQQPKKSNGVAVAALILGIVGFFCNPLYLVNLAAIFCGAFGCASAKVQPKGMAIAGLILGIVGIGVQLTVDLLITTLSFGLGFFTFLI